MFFYKRIINIINEENNKICGILTIIKKGETTNCSVKTFELNENENYNFNASNEHNEIINTNIKGKEIQNFEFITNEKLDFSKRIIAKVKLNRNNKIISQNKNEDEKTEKSEFEPIVLPFYESVKQKVENMFEKNEPYSELSKYIENSKWVKVDLEDNGLFYLLGLIYEKENVKYVCYALPAKKGENPPEHLKEFCKFVQCENENGFFVMMQNAETGESVK